MTEEEKMLRAKFHLAPKSTDLDTLRKMNKEYTAYPGLNKEQAQKLYEDLQNFKQSLDSDGVAVWIDGKKKKRF